MNDRFEPRQLSSDPAFGRPGSDEDPLLELARIVSGRSSAGEGSRRRAPMAAVETTSEADLARDLEAELLSDLQASFSMARGTERAVPAPRREEVRYDAPPTAAPVAAESPESAAEPAFGFLSLRRETVYEPDFRVEAPAADPEPVEPVLSDDTAGPVAGPDPFQALRLDYDEAEPASPAAEPMLEAPALDAADAPGAAWPDAEYDPAGYEPTEDQLQSLEPPPVRRGWRSRRGLTLVAGLFAVVLLGGVALIALRGENATAGAPVVIAADTSPIRIAGINPGPDPADANKLIYDRVDPAAGPGVETVLAPAEDPVPDVAGLGPGQTAPRVILRGAPGDDAIGGLVAADPVVVAEAVAPAAGETTVAAAGPRRVRTVTVRPDGTIVENGAAPAGETPVAAAVNAAPEAAPVPLAFDPTPAPAPAVVAATAAAAPVPEGPVIVTAAIPATPPAPQPDAPALRNTIAAAVNPPAAPAAAPPVRETTAAARPAARATAPAATNAPISLMPNVARQTPTPTPAPAPAAGPAPVQTAALAAPPATAAGGFVVQVSSQRSEEAAMAAFRDVQARVPSLLAGRQASIQRATLGDRGTFFRARVAPATTREAATQLCVSLKAAGVDCLVSQN